jgi:hypothetical protein
MVGGTQGRAVTRKEEEEEEGKDVGTRDQTASGTGALKRDKMQRGRKEETEKSVCSLSLEHRKCLLVTSSLGGRGGGGGFFYILGGGFSPFQGLDKMFSPARNRLLYGHFSAHPPAPAPISKTIPHNAYDHNVKFI